MKSLFKKIMSKHKQAQSDIPLAWLKELQHVDDITALETSNLHLSEINQKYASADDSKAAISYRIKALQTIDSVNRPRIQQVYHQYIRFQGLKPAIETRMFEAMYFHHLWLKQNYQHEIKALLSPDCTWQLDNAKLALLLLRAMQAVSSMICLRRLSQQPYPVGAWQELFGLYTYALQASAIHIALHLYDDLPVTTIDGCFVHLCMLDSLHACNMSRQQIALASRVIKTLALSAKSTAIHHEKKHLYYINFAEDKGARRIRQMQVPPYCRFWELDEILIKMDLISHLLKQHKSLASFALGDLEHEPHLLETLTLMKLEWVAYRRQRRREPRKITDTPATVCWGFAAVANQVKASHNQAFATGKTFEERLAGHSIAPHSVSNYSASATNLRQAGEHWIISDESSNGYGAKVEKDASVSIKRGQLANLNIQSTGHTNIIGIVRDVVEIDHRQHHIGIEVISRRASAVQVIKLVQRIKSETFTLASAALDMRESMLGIRCLYLPIEEGLSETATLIIPRIDFIENSLCRIVTEDYNILVKLGRAQDMQDDWARVTFEVTLAQVKQTN